MSFEFTDAALYWLLSSLPNERISSGGGGDYFVPYYNVELN